MTSARRPRSSAFAVDHVSQDVSQTAPTQTTPRQPAERPRPHHGTPTRTRLHAHEVSGGQGVAGSNPVSPTEEPRSFRRSESREALAGSELAKASRCSLSPPVPATTRSKPGGRMAVGAPESGPPTGPAGGRGRRARRSGCGRSAAVSLGRAPVLRHLCGDDARSRGAAPGGREVAARTSDDAGPAHAAPGSPAARSTPPGNLPIRSRSARSDGSRKSFLTRRYSNALTPSGCTRWTRAPADQQGVDRPVPAVGRLQHDLGILPGPLDHRVSRSTSLENPDRLQDLTDTRWSARSHCAGDADPYRRTAALRTLT